MSTTNFNKQVVADMNFLNNTLPNGYAIGEDVRLGSIRCKSKTGITNEDNWELIFQTIKLHFGKRFQEVYHITCTNHVDFIVYLKP